MNYIPLRERDEVRLLTLLPGNGDQQIRCTLAHAKLSRKPQYEALSYMWGSESEQQTISLNETECTIRNNLWTALKYLRQWDQPRVLWVDAVSINQDDPTERGHQVSQMGKVYREASTVVIWLGEADPWSQAMFEFFERSLRERIPESTFCRPHWIWSAIAQLCRRKYWSRLWIIQEVVLAANPVIQCGHYSIPWTSFSQVLLQLCRDRSKDDALDAFGLRLLSVAFTSNPRFARDLKTIERSPAFMLCKERNPWDVAERSMIALMRRFEDAECMDVRDKIFGLHEFALDCCKHATPIDYNCSAYELCARVLRHHMVEHAGDGDEGDEDPEQISKNLYRLIVGGALRQQGTHCGFEIGTPLYFKTLADIGETFFEPSVQTNFARSHLPVQSLEALIHDPSKDPLEGWEDVKGQQFDIDELFHANIYEESDYYEGTQQSQIETPFMALPRRERSPFKQGSPLAPKESSFVPSVSSAKRIQAQQNAEQDTRTPHSVSPNDAELLATILETSHPPTSAENAAFTSKEWEWLTMTF